MNTLLRICLLVACICISFPKLILACGNEYNSRSSLPLQNGALQLDQLLNSDDKPIQPYWSHGFGENIIHKRNSLLDSLAIKTRMSKGNKSAVIEKALQADLFQLLSDYAWYELRVGNKQDAINILEQLLAKHPKEYNILANLGTAYEVVGQDAKALTLLRKAVEINPASHFNSEWIHIKILEEKTTGKPDYSRIINLGTADFNNWISNHQYQFSIPADSLKNQIAYQLHERISFVDKPDAIVAQLVMDFADIVAKQDGFKEANPFYDFAASYDTAGIGKKAIEHKSRINQTTREIKTSLRGAAFIWAIPLLLFVLIFLALIRKKRMERGK